MLPRSFEGVGVMRKSDISYILCSVFAGAASLIYCCQRWFHIKLPRYYPIEHVWKWAKDANSPSQAWYSIQVFVFVSAGVITLAVYLVLKYGVREEVELGPSRAKWLGIATSLLVGVCLAALLSHEFSKWNVLG